MSNWENRAPSAGEMGTWQTAFSQPGNWLGTRCPAVSSAYRSLTTFRVIPNRSVIFLVLVAKLRLPI